jgi:ABC-type phosphate/phosphonate transport system permease subunit
MARKVIERIKAAVYPNHPDGIIRLNWLIFMVTAPFLALTIWHQNLVAWGSMGAVFLWGFTFSNAYLNRVYWKSVELHQQNLNAMLDTIQVAYYAMHEHCPNCGHRLKAPEEIRQ